MHHHFLHVERIHKKKKVSERGNREVGKVTFGGLAKNFRYPFRYPFECNRFEMPDFIGEFCGVPGHKFC